MSRSDAASAVGDRQAAGSSGRQADPARDRRREQPGDDERERRPEPLAVRSARRRGRQERRSTTLPAICTIEAEPAARAGCVLACAAVIHSSRSRRLTTSRNSVRTIASHHQPGLMGEERDEQARSGRSARHDIRAERADMAAQGDAGVPRQQRASDRQERRQRDDEQRRSPSRRARPAAAAVQPASSARIAAGADSERRRLSNIFQRPIAGTKRALLRAPVPVARPSIHGSNCQSPRAQRCWRAAATS